MARIYDNIDVKFTDGLQGIVTNSGVKRVDLKSTITLDAIFLRNRHKV